MSDIPPEAPGRLTSRAFSSGLSVPDFAACLHMGVRPVALVQGFCVMRWSWYGAGSMYGMPGYGARSSWGTTLSSYGCPHGYVGMDHRSWGENFEQRWVSQVWSDGFNTAYQRMLEEARAAGASGVIGVVDTSSSLVDRSVREFHVYGTAVVVDGAAPGPIWTSYLAGQRLAKLVDSGFMPTSIVASMASVRMWAVCTTEYLMRGQGPAVGQYGPGGILGGVLGGSGLGGGPGRVPGTVGGGFGGAFSGGGGYGYLYGSGEITQLSDAQMQARRLARDHVKAMLGGDHLQGARMDVGFHEIGEGDMEVDCILRGTRVRRFRPADPLPPPRLTVRLT